VHPMGFDIER